MKCMGKVFRVTYNEAMSTKIAVLYCEKQLVPAETKLNLVSCIFFSFLSKLGLQFLTIACISFDNAHLNLISETPSFDLSTVKLH